jgi:fructose-1,6-bisphosphatase I
LAFIAEQAGGLAVHDHGRILEKTPTDLHQRVPYYVGNKNLIEAFLKFQQAEK